MLDIILKWQYEKQKKNSNFILIVGVQLLGFIANGHMIQITFNYM
jgi:hypothetical protein